MDKTYKFCFFGSNMSTLEQRVGGMMVGSQTLGRGEGGGSGPKNGYLRMLH